MGGMTSSSSSTNSTKNVDQTTTTRPLPEQQKYLDKGWGQASDLLDRSNGNIYGGHFVQAPNSNQWRAADDSMNWAMSGGRNTANLMNSFGTGQLGSGTTAQNAALSGFNKFVNADQGRSVIDRANQYASQQNVDAIVNAGMRSAERNAAENTLPSLYRGAAVSGNINSDRTALADGVVQRGLAETRADLGATTRYNLFNQGAQNAMQQDAQRLQAIGAGGTLGTAITGQGYTGTQAGFDNYGKSLAAQQLAGDYQQKLGQDGLDDQMKRWYSQYQQPWQNLQNYWGIVGDLKGGTSHTKGTTTEQSETKQTPSLLSSIGSIGGMFGSLFCDKRAKDVLSGPVGSFKGIAPMYFFTYKHDESKTVYLGPMAQQVEQVRPDAVHELNGYKYIDLGAFN